jgi:hypothetical protein
VNRPVVEPELYASLRPQTYGQDMAAADAEFRQAGDKAKLANQQREAFDGRGEGKGEGNYRRATAGFAAPSAPPGKPADAWALKDAAPSVAQAADVGELFQYSISTPVTLPRQQSAMLPIVNASVKGEKVSIYNETVQAKHPLNGLKLVNNTELHLMQGPITVFDGGVYAGDAKIEDLSPGTTRLISYALDLDTEVAPEPAGQTEELTKVKVVKGVLEATRKHRRTRSFTVKNGGAKPKNVLIEHPISGGWNLVAPSKADDTTRDRYRFAVKAAPGKPEKLDVVEEHINNSHYALNNLDDNTIRFYISATIVDEKIKAALAEVIARKQAIAKVAQDRQRLEQKIGAIDQEQGRIRQNMAQLEKNSELYNRYVKKFADQETEVESLRTQIAGLLAEENKLRQSFDQFLIQLNL